MVSQFFDKVDRHQNQHHLVAPRRDFYRLIERNHSPELLTHMPLSSQMTTIPGISIPCFISNEENAMRDDRRGIEVHENETILPCGTLDCEVWQNRENCCDDGQSCDLHGCLFNDISIYFLSDVRS